MIPSLRLNTHCQATQAKRKNQSLAKSIQALPAQTNNNNDEK